LRLTKIIKNPAQLVHALRKKIEENWLTT